MAVSRRKFPAVDKDVEVYNPCTDAWISGKCIAHLSTQWVMLVTCLPTEMEFTIHPNWTWRYT